MTPPHTAGAATHHPLSLRTANPMRVDEQILGYRIDDITSPEARSDMEVSWALFLREGMQTGTFELAIPDRTRVAVDYGATANLSELFLSPAAVQTHVRNALTRLRAPNRAHGIAIALQAGELDLPVPEPPSEAGSDLSRGR